MADSASITKYFTRPPTANLQSLSLPDIRNARGRHHRHHGAASRRGGATAGGV